MEISQRVIMQLPLLVDGERPFIDGESIAVLEDHGIIVRQQNNEAVAEDRGATRGKCQMKITP